MYIYTQRLTDVLATCLIFCSRVTTFTCFCFVFVMYEHVQKKNIGFVLLFYGPNSQQCKRETNRIHYLRQPSNNLVVENIFKYIFNTTFFDIKPSFYYVN